MSKRMSGSKLGGAGVLLEPGMWDQLRLAWRLFRDPRVAPRLKTAVPVLTALYVLSPVDLVPDVLLGIGQVDDIGMIGIALVVLTRLVPRLAPPDVLAEHLAAMGLARPRAEGRAGQPETEQVVEATFRVRR